MTTKREVFISVDVETAGPIPGQFSLLSIGACSVFEPDRTFSSELKPVNRNFDPKALEVSGFSLDDLAQSGLDPEEAMSAFAKWVSEIAGTNGSPVFVGFNAPFDWSFVNYYFLRFTESNPFGFTALDIKALYMGATGCRWGDTRSSRIAERLHPTSAGTHDALRDAIYQAELYRLIWSQLVERP